MLVQVEPEIVVVAFNTRAVAHRVGGKQLGVVSRASRRGKSTFLETKLTKKLAMSVHAVRSVVPGELVLRRLRVFVSSALAIAAKTKGRPLARQQLFQI